MQQGSSAGAPAGVTNGTTVLTDEQILGLEPAPSSVTQAIHDAAVAQGAHRSPQNGDEDGALRNFDDHNEAIWTDTQDATASGPALPGTGDTAPQATAHVAAAEPTWLKALDAQPEAAAEARRWRDAAQSVASIDAAYFNADASARASLAARLHQDDPAAFRSMLAEAARVFAERDPQGLAELAGQLSAAASTAPSNFAAPNAAKSIAHAMQSSPRHSERSEESLFAVACPPGRLQQTGPEAFRSAGILPARGPEDSHSTGNAAVAQVFPASSAGGGRDGGPEAFSQPHGNADAFPAAAYREFTNATNAAVENDVRSAIDRTLSVTLSDGVAEGARRRIGDDIFREIHVALAADRDLSSRIGELTRGWQFNEGASRQIATLLAGRARNVLPDVARRVVSEWTSSVLASDRAKNARIHSAISRHDITGGRLPEPVASSALLPRRVDYARTSDEQILEM
jgi:hypothetical protein